MMIDFRTELGRMKKHRERYYPAIRSILAAGKPGSRTTFPMVISDPEEMSIVLELMDLGYLDEDAFIVTKSFGSITGLSYRGRYSLTPTGEKIYEAMKRSRARKRNVIIAVALVATAVCGIAAAFLLVPALR